MKFNNTTAFVVLMIIKYTAVNGNPGQYFLIAFPQNYHGKAEGLVNLIIISASNQNVDVQLTFHTPVWFVPPLDLSFKLKAGERRQVDVLGTIRMPIGTSVDYRSVSIRSTGNIIVLVYNKQASNGDAFLAIPVSQFGLEYFSVNYDITRSMAASFILITAPQNDTIVKVRLPKLKKVGWISYDNRDYHSLETMVIHLSEHQAFQFQVKDDLTGSHIVSNRPVSVISGLNRTSVYYNRCISHVSDLMPPVERMSTTYVTISFPQHIRLDVYRILAVSPDTIVSAGNITDIILSEPGQYKEIYLEPYKYVYIEATKPILVAQLSSSPVDTSNRFGDPSMVVLNPTDAAKEQYYFSTPNLQSYLTIVIDKDHTAGLRLDGTPIEIEWFNVTGNDSLVVGELVISQAKFHKVNHVSGIKFLGYIQGGSSCEAFAFPLGYRDFVTNSSCNAFLKEDSCMENSDNNSSINNQAAIRSVTSSSTLKYQYSLKSKQLQSNSIISCHIECVYLEGCWGYNYRAPSIRPGETNCHLLYGESAGNAKLDDWKFYAQEIK
ncbi:hypothetical protein LOTGIDRAFT_153832 [Lottia gigantea]|uniref:IgGFc-binding protein N-terminal domain-containing protein n=1 Tax=Lottia gigantea TaxID=225164 RepID=V4BRB5_LOTGI|nr:hypothetical protein LOTGIDRAFT_153832 [Lottia gigantea]ESO91394.1 hypothetical protein LOTGIDRAFT_153832 [Lottia gigantea]